MPIEKKKRAPVNDSAIQDAGLPASTEEGSRQAAKNKRRKLRRRRNAVEPGGPESSAESPSGVQAVAQQPRRKGKKKRREGEPPSGEASQRQTDDESLEQEAGAEADALCVPDLLGEELAERERARGRRIKRLVSPATVRIVSTRDSIPPQLFHGMKMAFADADIELDTTASDSDLIVNVGRFGSGEIQNGTVATVWIAYPNGNDGDKPSLAEMAVANDAAFVPVGSVLRRSLSAPNLTDDFDDVAAEAIGRAVRDIVLLRQEDASTWQAGAATQSADFSEAVALSETPSELLKALSWPGKLLPASLRPPFDPKSIEKFLDGNVELTVDGVRRPVAFYLPFDWATKREARADHASLHGLEFVTAILNYWNFKANGGKAKALDPVESALKDRGTTASQLLAAAGAIIADYLRAAPLLAEAWKVRVMQQRARALLLFLLCCRMAALRRIKFDDAICGLVFRALLDLLERLRPTMLVAPAAMKGVSYTTIIAALSLPLSKIRYGSMLLDEALENLNLYHLQPGKGPDGVWREGFPEHCSVFTALRNLRSDLRSGGISDRVLAPVITPMARFISAFVAGKDMCPPIAELSPVGFGKIARSARAYLNSASTSQLAVDSKVPGNANFFSDAGVFISRSTEQQGGTVSHLVVHARAVNRGGPSISFCEGADPLIIGGGTMNRKASPATRTATRANPGAHNAVRVNGLLYPNVQREAVRITNVWGGKSWAAARLVNETFADAVTARTIIHLTPLHALLVIDELVSHRENTKFELFWHFAPTVELQTAAALPCVVATSEGTMLAVAFDDTVMGDVVELRSGGNDGIGWTSISPKKVAPNPYLVRTKQAQEGVVGTFFRAGRVATPAQITTESNDEGWCAAVKMGTSELAVTFASGQLQLIAS